MMSRNEPLFRHRPLRERLKKIVASPAERSEGKGTQPARVRALKRYSKPGAALRSQTLAHWVPFPRAKARAGDDTAFFALFIGAMTVA